MTRHSLWCALCGSPVPRVAEFTHDCTGRLSRLLRAREHMAALVFDVNRLTLARTTAGYDAMKRDQRSVVVTRRWMLGIAAANAVVLVVNVVGWFV